MTFLLALGALSLLLAAGLALRAAVPLLSRLLLPAPLVAGFVGLALGPDGADVVPAEVVTQWAAWPALLITIVFAGLFLGAPVPAFGAVARSAGPLIRFSIVNAVGQYVVGFLLTWALLGPAFGVPALFGCLIEVGFSGGHGTASAMASVFTTLGFPAGAVLGQMSATVGLVTGVVGGVLLIQWGARTGRTSVLTEADTVRLDGGSGFVATDERRPIAYGTVSPVAIEPLTLHVVVTLLAVLLGWTFQAALRAVAPAFDGVPLFPLAMIGGMLLQSVADRTGAAAWLDRGTFQRITGLALDLLVAAAVATMRLDLFAEHAAPFSLLMVAAIVWCVASFVWIAPRMLPAHWFEQGLTVYGTQTGVAAVGLMLLRIADPQQRTTAAPAFAARSMVIAPLLGGGLVTAAMPLMVVEAGLLPMLAAATGVTLAAWFWPGGGRVRR